MLKSGFVFGNNYFRFAMGLSPFSWSRFPDMVGAPESARRRRWRPIVVTALLALAAVGYFGVARWAA